MGKFWTRAFDATEWIGAAELWLDPEGNDADLSECSMAIEANALSYQWSFKGEAQEGRFEFTEYGATWTDSWHQEHAAKCSNVPSANCLFAVEHSYTEPPEPCWNWRSQLSERPDGSLVLQMTNITPWGEEGRAVRMIYSRKSD